MVYDTTPLPSMVAVTEAPSGKAPSALRVALIASSKYLAASALSPASVKPVRVVVSCPVLVTSATTDWLVAPAVLPVTVVPVRGPMILDVNALSSDDWMLATAAFANSEEAPSKVISYETAPFSMLVTVTVAPAGRSVSSATVMAASKSSTACASSAAVMGFDSSFNPSTLSVPVVVTRTTSTVVSGSAKGLVNLPSVVSESVTTCTANSSGMEGTCSFAPFAQRRSSS